MLVLLFWQVLALLWVLFAAFVASHFYRVTLRALVGASTLGYFVFACLMLLRDDVSRQHLLGPLAWCYSPAVPLGVAVRPLLFALFLFALTVLYFVPRYMAHGLGSQHGTLRSVLFPFKAVALTFDDGPCPVWTPRVLEVLKRQQVKATFFMVGENIEKYPELALEVARHGHTVGVHSHTHRFLPLLSHSDLMSELDRAAQAFEAVFGRKPQFFRPPWGAYNRLVLDSARERGYLTVLWTRSAEDWRNHGVEAITALASTDVRLGEIILMHDAGNYPRPPVGVDPAQAALEGKQSREQTVAALDPIIEGIEEQGFQFKTLDEMVAAWLS